MTSRAWVKPAGLLAALVLAAAASEVRPATKRRAGSVPRERINPTGLSRPKGYTHVVTTRGGKHVFVSGQVALDANGSVVGKGDLKAQADKAYQNLGVALEAAGASFADVVKLNTYVVGLRPQHLAVLSEVRTRHLGEAALPASTLLGVQALAREGLLIEVEAVAVVP
jgi:enamine deaminase RidA (YjgF/YER057c/UK114 family)